MKFKRTALALAIAAVAAAPVAQAEVKLSGQVAILVGGSDADGAAGDPKIAGDDTTINVTATHTMNNGLTGYGVARFDALLTDSVPAADGIRVGIKGGFGDFRLGDTFNPLEYGQVAGDILTDVGENIEEQSIGYEGAFGPVTVGVVYAPEANADATGHDSAADADATPPVAAALGNDDDSVAFGAKFSLGGFAIGVGAGNVANNDRFSVGASFGFSGASIGVAFKDFDGVESIGVKGSYGIGNLSLALTYEGLSSDNGGVDGDNKIRFDGGYDLGGGMEVSTRINIFSDDTGGAANADLTDYRVMLVKTF